MAAVFLVVFGFTWYFISRQSNGGLSASGTIEATEVLVSSKVTGKVAELKFEEGDQVKAGDVLALIESDSYTANYNSVLARNDLAQSNLARSRELFNQNMISSQQYQAAQSEAEVAKSALELVKIQLGDTSIKSPITGTVMVKALEPGELAAIGTPVYTLANLDKVNLVVYLPEDQVGLVKLGQEVAVNVDSYPNVNFSGKVTHISDNAEFTPKSIQTKEERVTQVFGVKIEIPNLDGKLKPGMPADARFFTKGETASGR